MPFVDESRFFAACPDPGAVLQRFATYKPAPRRVGGNRIVDDPVTGKKFTLNDAGEEVKVAKEVKGRAEEPTSADSQEHGDEDKEVATTQIDPERTFADTIAEPKEGVRECGRENTRILGMSAFGSHGELQGGTWTNNVEANAPGGGGKSEKVVMSVNERQLGNAPRQHPSNMTILSHIYALESAVTDQLEKLRALFEIASPATDADGAGKEREKTISKRLKSLSVSTGENEQNEAESSQDPRTPKQVQPRLPLAVRNLPPLRSVPLHNQPIELSSHTLFKRSFLTNVIGGDEWAPGLYYPAKPTGDRASLLRKHLRSKFYYVMDPEVDPFLPRAPGEHGAKLTPFFRDPDEDETFEQIPLFMVIAPEHPDNPNVSAMERVKGEIKIKKFPRHFAYFGTYKQPRWSDKLDYDRMQEEVPKKVLEYWAKTLADKNRPEWVTRAMIQHFWPKPEYDTSTERLEEESKSSDAESAKEGLTTYVTDLQKWEAEAREELATWKEKDFLEAFARADSADPPGLRLQWEYLECTGFDRTFYYTLAQTQKEINEHDETYKNFVPLK